MFTKTNDKLEINLEPLIDIHYKDDFERAIQDVALLKGDTSDVILNNYSDCLNVEGTDRVVFNFGKYTPEVNSHHTSLFLPEYIYETTTNDKEKLITTPFITKLKELLEIDIYKIGFKHIDFPIKVQRHNIDLTPMLKEPKMEVVLSELGDIVLTLLVLSSDEFKNEIRKLKPYIQNLQDGEYLYIDFLYADNTRKFDFYDAINFYKKTALIISEVCNIEYLPNNIYFTYNKTTPDRFGVDPLFNNIRYVVDYIKMINRVSMEYAVNPNNIEKFIYNNYIKKNNYSSVLPIEDIILKEPAVAINKDLGLTETPNLIQMSHIMPMSIGTLDENNKVEMITGFQCYEGVGYIKSTKSPSQIIGFDVHYSKSYLEEEIYKVTRDGWIYVDEEKFKGENLNELKAHTKVELDNVLNDFFNKSTLILPIENILNLKYYLIPENDIGYYNTKLILRNIPFVLNTLKDGGVEVNAI